MRNELVIQIIISCGQKKKKNRISLFDKIILTEVSLTNFFQNCQTHLTVFTVNGFAFGIGSKETNLKSGS